MSERTVSFWEHLNDLRTLVVRLVLVLAAGWLAAWFFCKSAVEFLIRPLGQAVFIVPAESFLVHLAVSFWCGVVIVSPLAFCLIFRFLEGALVTQERRLFLAFFLPAALLFAAGLAFGYLVLVPAAMAVFLSFSSPDILPMIGLRSYVDFALATSVSCGLVFEFPLVVFFLNRLGVVRVEHLSRGRRAAILIIFIVAAVITPSTDAVSQCALALPLWALYEVSIILIRLFGKR